MVGSVLLFVRRYICYTISIMRFGPNVKIPTVLRGSKPEPWPWIEVLGFNVFLVDWLSLLTGGPALRECFEVGRRLTIGLRDSEPFSSNEGDLASSRERRSWSPTRCRSLAGAGEETSGVMIPY